MTQRTIGELETRLITIPLSRPWGADVREIATVEVTVTTNDGALGLGFSWTPSIGARAVQALLDHDIRSFVTGLPADPGIWQRVWEHLHEAGGGGVSTIALAGLDLALWDLRARSELKPLVDVLGRRQESQPAYGSGVNLHYSDDDLAEQVRRWIASGFDAVKIKIGRPDLADDLRRVALVRELLGSERTLMVDANQRWDLERASVAAEALEPFDIAWLEEPLRADDTAGYVELRRRTSIPIALGENAHTVYRFRDLIDAGACDVVQPNIVRVGGITPFLEIVELARDRGVTLAPHLLPELSASVALALPETTWVEDVEDARFEQLGVLARPSGLRVAGGRATIADAPVGIGVEFA